MSTLHCPQVRESVRAYRAGRLDAGEAKLVREHLASCVGCRAADATDAALTELLEQRLARPEAPQSLRTRLAALAAAEAPRSEPLPARETERTLPAHARAASPATTRARFRSPRVVAAVSAMAAAAVALLIVLRPARGSEQNALVREVVNDHLRVLYAQNPIEIESGGIHQVKPWFEGRLDFAPRVSVEDDPDFPLRGGAVSYVLDRKAATFVFKRRLHTISLFVFRDDGLPWPHEEGERLGGSRAQVSSQRGFNVVLFHRQDLGYALVSDLNLRELKQLGEKLAQP